MKTTLTPSEFSALPDEEKQYWKPELAYVNTGTGDVHPVLMPVEYTPVLVPLREVIGVLGRIKPTANGILTWTDDIVKAIEQIKQLK